MAPGTDLYLDDRIGDNVFSRHVRIKEGVDETRIRPILQQAPDEIGQQILVRADRGIDPHPAAKPGRAIKGLSHAVQTLEFECSVSDFLRQQLNGCHRMRIVRGKLRIDGVPGFQHLACTRQIIEIRPRLGREDREIGIALDMGVLDLAVPIGALHKPHHEAMAGLFGELFQPLDHFACPLLIGLHGKAQPIPPLQGRLTGQSLKNLQAQHQPVSFLCIETEIDVRPGRPLA